MELLRRPAYEGYPAEYLLARLRGRRAGLGGGGLPPQAGAGGQEPAAALRRRGAAGGMREAEAWHALRTEFRWVYRQMNGELRQTFAPLFLWFELRTILLCLRFRGGNERLKAAALLPASLLAERVQRVLTREGEAATVADDLAGLLATIAAPCRDLGKLYRQRGGKEFEQRLATLYLERMAELPLHPVLRAFFRAVIDMRNLVTLAKQLRWRLHEPRAFIRGGDISPERLGKALEEGTVAALAALLGALPDMGALPPAPANPEPLLYSWLTRKVRRLGRDPLGTGLVLDYLWRCFVEAHNLSLILQGEERDHEAVRLELIG